MESVANARPPVAPPRRKKKTTEVETSSLTKLAADSRGPLDPTPPAAAAAAKMRPVRPEPPKFRPDGSMSPTTKKVARKQPMVPKPPASSSPSSKPALSHFYSAEGNTSHQQNHYNSYTTPRRRHSKKSTLQEDAEEEISSKTTVINSRDTNVYLNVAPRPPQGGRGASKPSGNAKVKSHAENSPKGHTRPNRPTEMGTSRIAPKTPVNATKSLDSRQDFAKRPLPREPSKVPGRPPAPPSPPSPYATRKKMQSYMDRKVQSESDANMEYMYVDPSRYRYTPNLSRDLDGLDLSGCGEFDREEESTDDTYTSLILSGIADDVYTVPSPRSVSTSVPTSAEMANLSCTSSPELDESDERVQSPSVTIGGGVVYVNFQPKKNVGRSKSFVLNTSTGPNSPSPTSSQPPRPGDCRDEAHRSREQYSHEGNIYTAISTKTLESSSIYQVPVGNEDEGYYY